MHCFILLACCLQVFATIEPLKREGVRYTHFRFSPIRSRQFPPHLDLHNQRREHFEQYFDFGDFPRAFERERSPVEPTSSGLPPANVSEGDAQRLSDHRVSPPTRGKDIQASRKLSTLNKKQSKDSPRRTNSPPSRGSSDREENPLDRRQNPPARQQYPSGRNSRPFGRNTNPSGRNPNPSGRNPNPSDRNPNPSGRNPNPSGRNPNPSGRNPNPSGRSPNPSGRNPNPSGRNPNPSGRNPNPSGRNKNPSGRNKNPSGRNPNPSGRNPNPSGRNPNPSGRNKNPSTGQQSQSSGRNQNPTTRQQSQSTRQQSQSTRQNPSGRNPNPSTRQHQSIRQQDLSGRNPNPFTRQLYQSRRQKNPIGRQPSPPAKQPYQSTRQQNPLVRQPYSPVIRQQDGDTDEEMQEFQDLLEEMREQGDQMRRVATDMGRSFSDLFQTDQQNGRHQQGQYNFRDVMNHMTRMRTESERVMNSFFDMFRTLPTWQVTPSRGRNQGGYPHHRTPFSQIFGDPERSLSVFHQPSQHPFHHSHGFTYHHQLSDDRGNFNFWMFYRSQHFPHHTHTLEEHVAEEIPRFEVLCEFEVGYELRHYPNGTWVTTLISARTYDAAAIRGFKRLERYMEGQNRDRVKMNKTSPIQITVQSRNNDTISLLELLPQDEEFSVSLYLPEEFQKEPPEPRDEEIFIERTSMYVYAHKFDGWAYGLRSYKKYSQFVRRLNSHGQSIEEGTFYVHIYSPPWQLVSRHNEILIPAGMSSMNLCEELSTPKLPLEAESLSEQEEEEEEEDTEIPNGIIQCAEVECPLYDTQRSISPEVFLRHVGGGVYAFHKSTSCSLKESLSESYEPLQNYFSGRNVGNVTIQRTTPVIQMALHPSRGPATCNYTYELSLYLPREHHDNPPAPVDSSVRVSEVEPNYYYVLNFTGSTTPQILGEKYKELRKVLDLQGLCYQHNTFSLSVYDVPSHSFQQRNEISVPFDEFCEDTGLNGDIEVHDFYLDTNEILPPEYTLFNY